MNLRKVRSVMAFTVVAAICVGGCGGKGYSPAPGSPVTAPAAVDAQITGPYNIVLTSESQKKINIYTTFAGSGKTLTGAAGTLVCPSNDPTLCKGGEPTNASVTAHGAVVGPNVTLFISFPSPAGDDTVTMEGTAPSTNIVVQPPKVVGSYIDTQGDPGSWIASPANFATMSGQNLYSGTLNSTTNPLTILPQITMVFGADGKPNETGHATISNFPCANELVLSGDHVGDAFLASDSQRKFHLIALPSHPTSNGAVFVVAYQFDGDAPTCPGDFGRGTLTLQNIWDY